MEEVKVGCQLFHCLNNALDMKLALADFCKALKYYLQPKNKIILSWKEKKIIFLNCILIFTPYKNLLKVQFNNLRKYVQASMILKIYF